MMKRVKRIAATVLLCLCMLCAFGCTNIQEELALATEDYSKMLREGIPEDVSLTIYLLGLDVLYRKPQTVEDLTKCAVVRIDVTAEELKGQFKLLEKLDVRKLEPTEKSQYIDARVYYIFENLDGEKILDVAISPVGLGEIEGFVHINGICVYWNPIFYDLIEPFLTEEAHGLLGL